MSQIRGPLVSLILKFSQIYPPYVDGSSWSKLIPILQNAGHKIIAVQLPLHSLADDIATIKRAIDLVGGPVILVGHSYGGFVITNAAYNNPNVKGLVYIAAFAPNAGQSLRNFVDPPKLPKGFLVFDNGGFIYINPEMLRQALAQDVDIYDNYIEDGLACTLINLSSDLFLI